MRVAVTMLSAQLRRYEPSPEGWEDPACCRCELQAKHPAAAQAVLVSLLEEEREDEEQVCAEEQADGGVKSGSLGIY